MTGTPQAAADRTHVLVVIASLLLLALALTGSMLTSIERAIEELETLDRLRYTDLAAFAEQQDRRNTFLRDIIRRDTGARVVNDFESRGAVVRAWPTPSSPLRDYASFIEGDPRVLVVHPVFTIRELAQVVQWAREHPNPQREPLTLLRVLLRCHTEREDGKYEELWTTQYSPIIVDPVRSSCYLAEWHWSLGDELVVINNPLASPMVISDCCSGSLMGDWMITRKWLSSLGAPYSDLYDTVAQQALPHLHTLWPEVGSLTIKEAAQYLRQRQEGLQSLKVQGIALTASAYVLTPLVTAMLVLLLAAQIQRISVLMMKGGETRPAFALLESLDARILNLLTLLVLPATANILLLWRITWSSPQRGWAIVSIVFLLVAQARLVYVIWGACRLRRNKQRWHVT